METLQERLAPLLAELEEECAQAEVALRARNWARFDESMCNQRRTRQAIVNDIAAAECDVRTLPEVYARLQAIFTFRQDQLRRLTTYRAEVSKRLQMTRKWKDVARSARHATEPAPLWISRVQ